MFEFQESPVRTVIKDGEPWFVAKDVCEVLGIVNHKDAIRDFPEDEKGVVTTDPLGAKGGRQETNVINEPGLYRLIFSSRKEEAEIFKRWVFHEVLPSLRKTGRYELPQEVKLLIGQVEDLTKALELNSEQIKVGFPDHKADYLTEAEAEKLFGRRRKWFRGELFYQGYIEEAHYGNGLAMRLSEKGLEVGEEVLRKGPSIEGRIPFFFRFKKDFMAQLDRRIANLWGLDDYDG